MLLMITYCQLHWKPLTFAHSTLYGHKLSILFEMWHWFWWNEFILPFSLTKRRSSFWNVHNRKLMFFFQFRSLALSLSLPFSFECNRIFSQIALICILQYIFFYFLLWIYSNASNVDIVKSSLCGSRLLQKQIRRRRTKKEMWLNAHWCAHQQCSWLLYRKIIISFNNWNRLNENVFSFHIAYTRKVH